MKTMTAALCSYLEHQQKPIYPVIPVGSPFIPSAPSDFSETRLLTDSKRKQEEARGGTNDL